MKKSRSSVLVGDKIDLPHYNTVVSAPRKDWMTTVVSLLLIPRYLDRGRRWNLKAVCIRCYVLHGLLTPIRSFSSGVCVHKDICTSVILAVVFSRLDGPVIVRDGALGYSGFSSSVYLVLKT